ncbi:2-polyprenyl-6-methoxyphenol hydroxylase [Amycolatopsis arida]|uniref:2-polyprenyl-6-methoxyphenol hydroxylase n=1 Tax=Amycolatopsis arida TaxID=587909 RepID=A0A1I5M5Y0_9PSEU|nr:FAD-dependent monooxygenase [Amycolatopsis arida]TDX93981.1 2-polyprenyl-6-methoxyphenol hydroxylase-like FAD-dependent oxidoreductase [Amycolatopsis arida]SFP04920.1 2-polyprenyl-6-methoxyphenol hydroxylase [Amycolatopsis arida]
MPQAVVVGGGIGGLGAALGLRRAGWRVTVLERGAAGTDLGAGISLWPNALRGLRELGLGARLRPLLTPQRTGALRDRRGRVLAEVGGDVLERALGLPMVAIHRGQLLDLLRAALPAESLRYDAEVTGITPSGELRGAGTDLAGADLVVGADGIDSGVRAALWPAHPGTAYCGVTAFRAVVDPVPGAVMDGTWGPGAEFGAVPLVDGRLYWFVSLTAPEGLRPADRLAFLRTRLRDWHPGVHRILERTPPEAVLQHDVRVLAAPLDSYVRGRVVLLGDAAHAMAPFLGQGGCQAIEDAVVLAAELAREPDVPTALARYDRVRRPRTQGLARASELAGRFGHRVTNPVAVALRNTVLRLLPAAVAARGTMAAARWTPPRIEPA